MLVGNKTDLREQREVVAEQAQEIGGWHAWGL